MRYFLGFLVTIGLIVLIIVLLLSGRGGDSPATKKPTVLYNYANSTSSAELVIDGPVNADVKHQSTRIVVDSNSVKATLYDGYQQAEVRSLTYDNNRDAYEVFLRALQHSGFTLRTTDAPKDERGYCPSGRRYIMTFNNNGEDLIRTWTTSCASGAAKGSFAGPLQTTLNLFKAQVPDYNKLVSGASL